MDYFRKTLQSYMFDRVLNMPVNYLSSFVLVIRGIHAKVVVYAKLIIVFTLN